MKTKFQKRKDRERRVRRRKVHSHSLVKPVRYPLPGIVFPQRPDETAHMDGRKVRVMTSAARSLWRYERLEMMGVDADLLTFVEVVRTFGFERAMSSLVSKFVMRHPAIDEIELEDRVRRLICRMHSTLANEIILETGRLGTPLDSEYADCRFETDKIAVRLHGMRTLRTGHGTMYYSASEPKARFDGEDLLVCYTAHLRRRMYDRLIAHNGNYMTDSGVDRYLDEYRDFGIVRLPSGEQAIEMWLDIVRSTGGVEVVRQVLGEEFAPGDRYKLKIGYCPAVANGEILVCKTIMNPGMDNTPEQYAAWRLKLPQESLIYSEMTKDNNYKAIADLHAEGFTQLKKIEFDA